MQNSDGDEPTRSHHKVNACLSGSISNFFEAKHLSGHFEQLNYYFTYFRRIKSRICVPNLEVKNSFPGILVILKTDFLVYFYTVV